MCSFQSMATILDGGRRPVLPALLRAEVARVGSSTAILTGSRPPFFMPLRHPPQPPRQRRWLVGLHRIPPRSQRVDGALSAAA